ncbi:MAG: hypothetical protein ACK5MO_16285, partial [Planctomyces sp.]
LYIMQRTQQGKDCCIGITFLPQTRIILKGFLQRRLFVWGKVLAVFQTRPQLTCGRCLLILAVFHV